MPAKVDGRAEMDIKYNLELYVMPITRGLSDNSLPKLPDFCNKGKSFEI